MPDDINDHENNFDNAHDAEDGDDDAAERVGRDEEIDETTTTCDSFFSGEYTTISFSLPLCAPASLTTVVECLNKQRTDFCCTIVD